VQQQGAGFGPHRLRALHLVPVRQQRRLQQAAEHVFDRGFPAGFDLQRRRQARQRGPVVGAQPAGQFGVVLAQGRLLQGLQRGETAARALQRLPRFVQGGFHRGTLVAQGLQLAIGVLQLALGFTQFLVERGQFGFRIGQRGLDRAGIEASVLALQAAQALVDLLAGAVQSLHVHALAFRFQQGRLRTLRKFFPQALLVDQALFGRGQAVLGFLFLFLGGGHSRLRGADRLGQALLALLLLLAAAQQLGQGRFQLLQLAHPQVLHLAGMARFCSWRASAASAS